MTMQGQQYWRQKMQQGISSLNPNIDVEFGTVFDTIVHPTGVVLEELSQTIDDLGRLIDLGRWPEWSDTEMEQIAANYGLTRRSGTKATGVVLFFTTTKPTQDVVIPRNTVVSTINRIQFRTVARLQIPMEAIDGYKNVVTGRYEFPVHVEAVKTGATGNVAAGSIIVYNETGAVGAVNVVNRAGTIGGGDPENNQQLSSRIRMLVQGGIGGTTVNGLRLRLLAAFEGEVTSVAIEADSPIVDGTTDVWFVGSKLDAGSLITYWFSRDIVLSVGSIVDVVSVESAGVTYAEGVDWVLVRDLHSGWARTSQSRDAIRWISASRPTFGAQVTIQYTKNVLLDCIEAWANMDHNKVMGLEIKYREGVPIQIELRASLGLVRGFGGEVVANVRESIAQFINTRGLGESLEMADVIHIAKQVPGVDNITITKLSLKGGDGVADLVAKKSEYFRGLLENIIIT